MRTGLFVLVSLGVLLSRGAVVSYPAEGDWDGFRIVPVGARRVGADVLSNGWLNETTWRVSSIHPCGANALAAFAAALAGSDAQVLSCGGFLIGTLGYEPELAAFMREYRKLPAVHFKDAPSPPGWVVRRARLHGNDWEYRVQTVPPYRLEVTVMPGRGRAGLISQK